MSEAEARTCQCGRLEHFELIEHEGRFHCGCCGYPTDNARTIEQAKNYRQFLKDESTPRLPSPDEVHAAAARLTRTYYTLPPQSFFAEAQRMWDQVRAGSPATPGEVAWARRTKRIAEHLNDGLSDLLMAPGTMGLSRAEQRTFHRLATPVLRILPRLLMACDVIIASRGKKAKGHGSLSANKQSGSRRRDRARKRSPRS